VGPRAVLDAVVNRKIPSPRRESNSRTPIVQPVAQRYTDWAITALLPVCTGFKPCSQYLYFLPLYLRSNLLSHGYRGFPPREKRLGREANNSTPSSAEVKNAWSYTSTHPYGFMVWCLIKRCVFMAWYLLKHRDSFICTCRFATACYFANQSPPVLSTWSFRLFIYVRGSSISSILGYLGISVFFLLRVYKHIQLRVLNHIEKFRCLVFIFRICEISINIIGHTTQLRYTMKYTITFSL
jgi:hypothetical protein